MTENHRKTPKADEIGVDAANGADTQHNAVQEPYIINKEQNDKGFDALLPIYPHDKLGRAVDAKQLHAVLGVGARFNDWFARKLQKYDFSEGYDFYSELSNTSKTVGYDFSPELGKTSKVGGRPTTEYALTIDMAKELAMVENNEMGRKIRRYLIAIEKNAMEMPAPKPIDFDDVGTLQGLLLQHLENSKQLQQTIDEQLPKVAVYDKLVEAEGDRCLQVAAKGLGMQPKKFIQWLSAERWIFKRGGKGPWIAYQDRIQLGYMSTREHRWTTEYGEERSSAQALITPKGMVKLARMHAEGRDLVA